MPKKTLKGKFKPSQSAEAQFFRALKAVAKHTGHIIDAHTEVVSVTGRRIINLEQLKALNVALTNYAKLITPWAQRQSARLLEQVQGSNRRAYVNKSKAIGKALNLGVAEANVGRVAQALMAEQVGLITSLPIESGLRVQKLAAENFYSGTRASTDDETIEEIQKQLGSSTEVAVSRAQLIARTETARANASINQARARAVGSRQYRWHNSGDAAVRESHRIYQGMPLQGRIFSWDDPPTLDDGMTGNPGSFPNCRCFAEPVFDDE